MECRVCTDEIITPYTNDATICRNCRPKEQKLYTGVVDLEEQELKRPRKLKDWRHEEREYGQGPGWEMRKKNDQRIRHMNKKATARSTSTVPLTVPNTSYENAQNLGSLRGDHGFCGNCYVDDNNEQLTFGPFGGCRMPDYAGDTNYDVIGYGMGEEIDARIGTDQDEKKVTQTIKLPKHPMNTAPMELLEIFARMCQYGLDLGYEPHTWLTNYTIGQHLESLKRHIKDYERGIDVDKDGFKNLEAIMWRASCAALIEHYKLEGKDDRWLKNILLK